MFEILMISKKTLHTTMKRDTKPFHNEYHSSIFVSIIAIFNKKETAFQWTPVAQVCFVLPPISHFKTPARFYF